MKTTQDGKSVQYTFQAPAELIDRLVETKFEYRKASVSQIVREAVTFYMQLLDERDPRHPLLHSGSPFSE